MAVIGSLMKTDMVTAAPGETVAHAAYAMSSNGIGALVVVDDGKLVGFLSERDVLKRVVAEGLDPASTTVLEVATPQPITVEASTPVQDCSQLMREKDVRHLPVVHDGKPVGIISSRDLFGFVVESLERVIDDEQYARALALGDDPYDHVGGSYGR
jgi:CBS domain-containing protein